MAAACERRWRSWSRSSATSAPGLHPRDVMYFDEWPMRHHSLLVGGLALDVPDYGALWRTLKAESEVDEVVRNFFIRQPVLWV